LVKLKSLEDLENWKDYRVFTRDEFAALPPDGAPIFISKLESDFDLGGKTWKEGVCRRQGDDLGVEQLSGGLLKGANTTLKKMAFSWRLVPSKGGGDASSADSAAFAKLKKQIVPHVKSTVDSGPSNRATIVKFAKEVSALENAGDFADAVKEAVVETVETVTDTVSDVAQGAADKLEAAWGSLWD
jgi:hypothetical protein